MDKKVPIDIINRLETADPVAARIFHEALSPDPHRVDNRTIAWMAEETLEALSLTPGFGHAVAKGFTRLITTNNESALLSYVRAIREAALVGPALGTVIARYLPPVLLEDNPSLEDKFHAAVSILNRQGAHTLGSIMEGLAKLLVQGDSASALAYLDLLPLAFTAPLTYHQYLNLSVLLPKAAVNFSASRRSWQIRALGRVIREDVRLAEPFLEGMGKGLSLLKQDALDRFIQSGFTYHRKHPDSGGQYFSLILERGREQCKALTVAIPLSAVRDSLNRYLRARTGSPIHVRPLSSLSRDKSETPPPDVRVCSDGRAIFLPDEIDRFETREENRLLYHRLAKIESGFYEFGSFDFDLKRMNINPDPVGDRPDTGNPPLSDFHRFFQCFPNPKLAEDLLSIIEQGRIRLLFEHRYPGLAGGAYPFLQKEAHRLLRHPMGKHPLFPLYMRIALGDEAAAPHQNSEAATECFRLVSIHFSEKMNPGSSIADSASMARRFYGEISSIASGIKTAGYDYLETPYGLRLRPDLFFTTHAASERLAQRIHAVLKQQGLDLYPSEVRSEILRNNGSLSPGDLRRILIKKRLSSADITSKRITGALSSPEILQLIGPSHTLTADAPQDGGDVYRYPEWDAHMGDYLKDHVRVLEKKIHSTTCQRYDEILMRHRGLASRMRYAFEFLKPEGLVILRRWREGEAFDYRALLDFAVDRKAGLMPSDQLYTKRIKQDRDVAVLLLVDLSRSTATPVNGSGVRVIDVEKEAMVLFCEALEIVGDTYAIAGFSGTGPLGVDYYRIKDFCEPLGDPVKSRICGMEPKRSTRMGAAIRHATHCLAKVTAKVRLLIVLGDGFPNDLGYKATRAIADTRCAVNEARGKHILTRAITVNMGQDPKLDALYGDVNHYVISDVKELPDRLLGMYARLTKH